ncbi:MAG: hypothetical protein KGH61_00455 [Candidatus Micrarchaeota archaeon]|nr:hypothetical protein [Candidatus Micrarchaeota archaeon]MDE1847408.1 hypothetical protein [Candidatus Micrarchaeota archaeon]MDE1864097.1 hypothetical protein [Candidatus Micrarchaeota archaeon]
MPNRNTLNKYELFVTEVHRLAKRKQLEAKDLRIKKLAMLIASLSSNHSWRTYKYLNGGGEIERTCMLDETRQAFSEGWKNITESDIEEVVNANTNEYMFSMWLYHVVDKEQRHEFKELHKELKTEYADGLEPIERVLD